ncbi:cobalt transporter CbiM [Methanosarcinales archaeon]|nr:MAG: cobalt transporter CbiM [Methanosarcinales archaeon]
MVHISDGILSTPILVFGWAISIVVMAATIWWSGRRRDLAEEIPKLSVMTAAFFIASLIHIPVGPTSVHFILSGLLGVVLGVLAYPAIFIGVVLQAFLFQHGGVTTIGVNTLIMGISALIAGVIFRAPAGRLRLCEVSTGIVAALAGGVGVLLAALFAALTLIATGRQFFEIAGALVAAHIPIVIIEAVVTGSIITFMLKVKPELIGLGRSQCET